MRSMRRLTIRFDYVLNIEILMNLLFIEKGIYTMRVTLILIWELIPALGQILIKGMI